MRGPLHSCEGRKELDQEQVLVAFDSVMNDWLESVPDHCSSAFSPVFWLPPDAHLSVRWNVEELDRSGFFHQSAFLHITYHYIHVMIHRPFIPTPSSRHVASVPSVVVCTTAAKSALAVVQAMNTRGYIYSLHLLVGLDSPRGEISSN
jgi:hypothetical protein